MPIRQPFHCILPPDLLDRLARAGDEATRNAALDTLHFDQLFRVTRAEMASRLGGRLARPITFARIGGRAHCPGRAPLLRRRCSGA